MEKIVVFNSVILTGITLIYVFLTSRMLKEQIKGNQRNFLFMQKQLDMHNIPIINCEITKDFDSIFFSIHNISAITAYNVEVYIYCYLSYGKAKKYAFPLFPLVKEGYVEGYPILYSAIDCHKYPIFMNKKKVSFKPLFPFTHDNYNIILEYADLYGEYHSSYFEFHSEDNETYFLVNSNLGFGEKHKYIYYRAC